MFGWFKRKTIEEQYTDQLLAIFKDNPKGAEWVFSLCKKDKGLLAMMLKYTDITEEINKNEDKIEYEQACARASVFAHEEDRLLITIEEKAEDQGLKYMAKTRRDELWAPDGIIGRQASKYKS